MFDTFLFRIKLFVWIPSDLNSVQIKLQASYEVEIAPNFYNVMTIGTCRIVNCHYLLRKYFKINPIAQRSIIRSCSLSNFKND
jgi:hypothetical protein